jgi:purine-binding chemotaxis protein CheW
MANMTQQDIDKIGVFWLNDIHIGLPISDILEVVPANALVATPNEHPALLGCLNLRGILIPVYSLFFYFQQDATQSPTFSIVIVQQGNQLLGLQVSGVTDIYSRDQTQSSSLNASPVQSGQTQPFINGAIQIATLPHSVYWLNLAAIFAQPNLLYAEMTDVVQHDTTVMHLPDTSTSMHDTPDQEQDTDDTRHTHLLLLKIGTLQFALNATDIFATVLNPRFKASTMQGDYCVGSIHYSGIVVPAIDLSKLCGICSRTETSHNAMQRAFLMRYPEGFIAFMIEDILDVRQEHIGTIRPMSRASLHYPEFIFGMIDLPAINEAGLSPYYLYVNSQALLAYRNLEQLSKLITVDNQKEANLILNLLRKETQEKQNYQIITYHLDMDVATPVEQISQIIAWNPHHIFGHTTQGAGILIEQDKVVSVYNLRELLGFPPGDHPSPTESAASVLIVSHNDDHIGFIVSQLNAIEEASQPDSEDEIITPPVREGFGAIAAIWSTARIVHDKEKRMICQINLRDLAQQLLKPAQSNR